MRSVLIIILGTMIGLVSSCGGGGGGGQPGADTTPEVNADVPADTLPTDLGPDGPPMDALLDIGPDGPPGDIPHPDVGPEGPPTDTEEDVTPEDQVDLPEALGDAPAPSCEGCLLLQSDAWDDNPATALQSTNPTFETLDEASGLTFWFRAFTTWRLPAPGTLKNVWVYSDGGAGAITIRFSTGFPGGHHPCLDEATGDDPWAVGPAFRMEVSSEPGWRIFDVSAAAHHVEGYNELFMLLNQEGNARVGLAPAAVPGDPQEYDVMGGLIADAPGDNMECFSSMSAFEYQGAPLIWIARAELEPDGPAPAPMFQDMAAEGPAVGGHAAFGDYDNDGDDDLLSGGTLWRNDGGGAFTNVTADVNIGGAGGETVWGDYDNDGWRDILAIGGDGKLFRNLGDGTFEDVTVAAGVVLDTNTQGVAWFDFDGDGHLDFYAASYGLSSDGEIATRDFFYYNKGNGTFEELTAAAGIPVTGAQWHGRGICIADYDEDGDPDVYVGNYRLDPNQLWNNLGNGMGFKDVAAAAGVKGTYEQGAYGHAIGPGFADLDGDGRFDILLPNLAHPRFFDFSDPTTLYINEGDGTFTGYEPPSRGIVYDETHSDSTLFDADNDGDVDVFLTSVYVGRRSFLYLNDGTGNFTDGTWEAGILHLNGWGAAAADVDGDGDQDLMANRLFLNEHEGGHWLEVKLVGGATPGATAGWSNRDAIGAVVEADLGDRVLTRQVEGGTGVGCQNSAILHFGLADLTAIPTLTVKWPSGNTTVVFDAQADQLIEIHEKDEQGLP
ncbi:MAG: FG-GAP-like repeat-containing protein [Pseudomonadota bacterium]